VLASFPAAALAAFLFSFPINKKIGQNVRSGKQTLNMVDEAARFAPEFSARRQKIEKNVCCMIKLKLNFACLI